MLRLRPVARLILATGYLFLAAGMLGCARGVVKPSAPSVRIVVTDARLDRLPVYAAEVKAQRGFGPTIWFVTGGLFEGARWAMLADGAAQIALLNKAGVDAVCLTPDWLRFGLPRVGRLIADARFYVLSGNLLDASGQSVGQPMFVRKFGWNTVAATGVSYDSSDVLLRVAGIKRLPPAFGCRKIAALMRQRADFVGAMVEPSTSAEGLGVDFAVNDTSLFGGFPMPASDSPDTIFCYGLHFQGAAVNPRPLAVVDLTGMAADSAVSRIMDSLMLTADSLAARAIPLPRVAWTRASLNNELVRGLLAARLADGFVCDSLFVADFKEPKDVGSLISLLRDPGRLALLSVRGDELSAWPEGLVLRPGLSRAGLTRDQTYRVATTVDYLQRHPDMARPGFELSDRPLWTICLDILQSGRVK